MSGADPSASTTPNQHHRALGRGHDEETDVTMFAQELASDRWARDLSTAQEARLAAAIRRRRASERSQARARRLVRLAGLAAQRSESLSTGALGVAR